MRYSPAVLDRAGSGERIFGFRKSVSPIVNTDGHVEALGSMLNHGLMAVPPPDARRPGSR